MENQEVQDSHTNVLKNFQDESDDIIATAIINKNGTMKTSLLPPSIDKDTIAVIVSSVIQTSKDGISQFGSENFKRLLLKNQQGFIVIQVIDEEDVLFVLAKPQAKPGSLLLLTEELVGKMSNVA